MHRKYKYLTLGLGAGIIPMILTASGLVGGSFASAYNQPSATVNVPDSISSGTLEPNVNHPYAISKFYTPVTIDVTDVNQYQVYISAVGDVDLKGETNTENILHSVTSTTGIPIASMDNEWGYYAAWSENDNHAEDHLYARVPATATEIDTRTPHGSETKVLNVNFAAKVNGEQPADIYTGTIKVSVVYTPELTTLFDITYMQDMEHSVCSLTHTPNNTATETVTTKAEANTLLDQSADGSTISKIPEVSLIDKRDNKVYKVAKLADDNCWMVQNLALEGSIAGVDPKVLTPTDSDIASGSYQLPVGITAATLKTTNPTDFGNDTIAYISNGTHVGYSADGITITEDAANDTASGGNNTGAYYSWIAATAGSGSTYTQNEDKYKNAPSSVCPKGWKLPTGGNKVSLSADTPDDKKVMNGQFQRLYDTYGATYTGFQAVWHSGFPGRYVDGVLGYSGTNVVWWSSTIDSDTSAYILYINSSSGGSVNPKTGHGRRVGGSVRCVAR